jgi:O-methyltransferase
MKTMTLAGATAAPARDSRTRLDPDRTSQWTTAIRRVLPTRAVLLIAVIRRILRLPDATLRALLPHLIRGHQRFQEDGLFSLHNCDFLNEPRFQKAYALGEATGSWGGYQVRWRAYVVCWCAEMASHLEGDFVECGVNRGGLTRMVLDYLNFENTGKRYLLFDTFQGLSEKHVLPEESHLLQQHVFSECLEAVKRTFSPFPSVKIIQGTVPETLALDDAKRVAFLSIDMNCVTPEIEAAEHFWPKLAPGAVIVLDDYGFEGHILQKKSFDDFAASKGTAVLSLPTGQGLIFKPR